MAKVSLSQEELRALGKANPNFVVTNFNAEYQYLNKSAAIAFLEETREASDVIAVAEFKGAPEDTFKPPNPFDVNPALPQAE